MLYSCPRRQLQTFGPLITAMMLLEVLSCNHLFAGTAPTRAGHAGGPASTVAEILVRGLAAHDYGDDAYAPLHNMTMTFTTSRALSDQVKQSRGKDIVDCWKSAGRYVSRLAVLFRGLVCRDMQGHQGKTRR